MYILRIRIIMLIMLFCLLPGIGAIAQLSPGDLASVHAHLEGTANCTKCHVLGEKVSNEKCLDCHKEIQVRIASDKGYHSSKSVKNKDCFICHNDHHGREFQIIRFDPDTFNHQLTGYRLEGTHALINCKDCHNPQRIVDQELRKKDMTYLGLSTACLSCHNDYHQGTLSAQCIDCHDFEQFSPATRFDHGRTDFPLRGKHKQTDCASCHKSELRNGIEFRRYKGIEHDNCTPCHDDVHDNKFGQECIRCHTEESFHILKNLENIDHSKTSFPLIGRHRSVDCKDCHKRKYTDPLPHNQCMDCHDDYHEGQFIKSDGLADCSDCHDMSGFAPSTFSVEQHQETAFPLEGAHLATPCFLCHKNELADKWQFRELGKKCSDCHEDIHEGYIDTLYYPGTDCRRCHDVSRWQTIDFNHILTGYALEGKHMEAACRDCHFIEAEGGQYTQQFGDLTTACKQCHNDIHYMQFDEYGHESCLRCHSYLDWGASTFNHDSTNFKLDGTHRDLACLACHKEKTENGKSYVLYKIEDYQCEDCH